MLSSTFGADHLYPLQILKFPNVKILEVITDDAEKLGNFVQMLLPSDNMQTFSTDANRLLPLPSLSSFEIRVEDSEASKSDVVDRIATMLERRHAAGARLQCLTINEELLDESRYGPYVETIRPAKDGPGSLNEQD